LRLQGVNRHTAKIKFKGEIDMPSTLQILFTVFENVFGFWPLFLLAIFWGRKSRIRNVVYVWGFWAIIRIILFFNPEPIAKPLTLIPEPTSTMLFFLTGLILIFIWVGISYWKQRRI